MLHGILPLGGTTAGFAITSPTAAALMSAITWSPSISLIYLRMSATSVTEHFPLRMVWPTIGPRLTNQPSLTWPSQSASQSVSPKSSYKHFVFAGCENDFLVKCPSDNKISCTLCAGTFARKDSARRHVRLVHMSEEGACWQCALCGRRYKNKLSLQCHQRQEHKIYKTELNDSK